MDDLVRWQHIPNIEDENNSQVGVYTFYLNREISHEKNILKSKLKRKKSKSSLCSKQLKNKEKPMFYESKKKHPSKQLKKIKTEQKQFVKIGNMPQSFLKNIFQKKNERSLSKKRFKGQIDNIDQIKDVQQKIKLKIRDKNNSIKPSSHQRYDLLKRCRTSIESGKSIIEEKEKRMKRMHTEVMVNFSQLSMEQSLKKSIKSPKVINLNEQNEKILGPQLVFEQKSKVKDLSIPYFPQIKKSHIDKYLKIIEEKKQQERVQLLKSDKRSKSTLKSYKKISNKFPFTKNIQLDHHINCLKIIELGKNSEKQLQHDWPEDKKAYLRKMGFKC